MILISGRGSNMEAIISACRAEKWPAVVAAVIASRPDAAGLSIAASLGIATEIVDAKGFESRNEFESELAKRIDAHDADCIALAGFMRVLSAGFVARYSGRLLNIHPSLLPAFPGLATHARALAAGVRVHGATVHFVSAVVDNGPIIAQAVVPVKQDDDPETLAARVLAAEHRLYPRALSWFVSDRLTLEEGRAQLVDAIAEESLMVCP